ncbi:N-acetyl-gamma-glutamyl-phosphate reductase, partial [Escherichia coli]
HSMHENSSVLYPHLVGLTEQLIEPFDAEKIQKENQLVFFATPAGISKELAATFVANDFPVIDLSGDLRLKDRDRYQKWYHQE